MASTETKTALELANEFVEQVDYTASELEAEIKEKAKKFRIPEEEAARLIRNSNEVETEISGPENESETNQTSTNFSPTPIKEINQASEWHDIHVKVIYLWERSHDSMVQVGLLGGMEENIKFVTWEDENGNSPVQKLEKGESYLISNVVTDEYNGQYSVELRSQTTIEKTDEDPTHKEAEGIFVDYQSGSGLIKRCSEDGCTRVINNSRCVEHGEIENGEFDLRIKAIIDDGETPHNVIYQQEATEEVLGVTLEEAKQAAMDELDLTIVEDMIDDRLVGSFVNVKGPVYGDYLSVEKHTELEGVDDKEIEALQNRVNTGPESSGEVQNTESTEA